MDLNLNPPQWKFWNSDARWLCLYGGTNSGKSWIAAMRMILYCLTYNGAVVLAARQSIGKIKLTMIPSYVTEILVGYFKFDIRGDEYLLNWNKTDRILEFTNHSKIIFKEMNEQSDPDFTNLLGLKINAFHLDEAWEISKKAFEYCQLNCGRVEAVDKDGNQAPPLGILTLNPRHNNWWEQIFNKKILNGQPMNAKTAAEYELILCNPMDNVDNLPTEKIKEYLSLPEGSFKDCMVYGKIVFQSNPLDVFPLQWVTMCYIKGREFKLKLKDKKFRNQFDVINKLGCDPALTGVVTFYRIEQYTHRETQEEIDLVVQKWSEEDLTDARIAKHIDSIMTSYDILDGNCGVDSSGNEVLKYLRDDFFRNVVGIQGAAKPSQIQEFGHLSFNNLRSQLHWLTRTNMEKHKLLFGIEEDNSLEEDLMSIRQTDDDKPYIKIEEKSHVKKRIGRSPDNSDTLIYAHCCNKINTVNGVIDIKGYRPTKVRVEQKKVMNLWL